MQLVLGLSLQVYTLKQGASSRGAVLSRSPFTFFRFIVAELRITALQGIKLKTVYSGWSPVNSFVQRHEAVFVGGGLDKPSIQRI